METKFTKSTDKEHKIKLESSILHALWSANVAYAGSEVGVEVKTMFVGEGGKINITGKSEKGKNLGKIKDKIYGNGYSGKLKIPDKIKPGDVAYFTVKLPQLGLKAESNRIRLVPKIEVSNMKWDKKEARRGDTLKLTADVEGVRDESEVKVIIYEHDRDGNHDKIAEIPTKVQNNKVEVLWEYEYHEDTDEIPTEEELQEHDKKKHYRHPEYFFTMTIGVEEFGKEQESGILKFKDFVEITLQDEDGNPYADEEYIMKLPDGSEREGRLAANGYARLDDVPPGEYIVTLPYLDSGSGESPREHGTAEVVEGTETEEKELSVTNLSWNREVARRGDTLNLTAEVTGVDDGTEATIRIWEYDDDGSHDFITKLSTRVKDSRLSQPWDYEYYEDVDEERTAQESEKGYNPPEYFFTVEVNGQTFGEDQESGMLEFKDFVEFTLKDPDGKPYANEDYILTLPDGTEREGKLDADGHARIEDVPPGEFTVTLPNV